jgi:hypothetical protein
MNAERARWQIAGVAVLLLALGAFIIGSNPANLPEPLIDHWIRNELPLGSSIVAVRNEIEKEGWTTVYEAISDDGSTVVVQIGRSWLTRNYAKLYLSFDRFGRLAAVRVEKSP